MSVKAQHHETNAFFYCTFTCNRWINLFSITDFYDEIYKWFHIMEEANYKINVYVIMPNHVHFIIHSPADKKSLNTRISNGKRFMAYELVKRLKNSGEEKILDLLKQDVTPSDRKAGKLHQVFKDSFDARLITSLEMMNQKVAYIHNNPVVKKWRLAEDIIDYPHSSAKFYETGRQGVFKVTNYAELW